ncbi:hypothetical protein [Methylobacterium soli]|uniref:Uncharacterized protein n=1 Tax=Methylobacterium soli TaxID=553447 RepID=A0A6L3SU73_9HYPH|nr:hypothetical protein [Methylobacterium soli]KAB1077170.1 hypothetical protein F6X53_20025 [Methylobacterium soli]GJE43588.1 hypothetical protein AEGHOMDF_2767 [Methylobacterium soli]
MIVSKRPSVIGGLKLPGSDARALAADGAPEQSDAAPNPKPAGRVRPEVVHTSVYLPREVHRRLREIAFTRDCKVHDVIMEGIDAALQKHGHPSVDTIKGDQRSKQ